MFKPLAIMMGVAMLSLGASVAQAQVSVRPGRVENRDNGRRENDRGVGQQRVWVEDFAMVEERYQEAGRYENREVQVWVAEKRVTVTERVLIPESRITVEEQVYVAGQNVTIREAHTLRNGSIHYIDRVKWVPAHYECRQVVKCVPAHYEDRQVVKCIPGHYETVCQRVWIEGCTKTRMVKKCIGGHWEVCARR